MLQFDQIQDRVVRLTRRKKYELCILIILIYIVILGFSLYDHLFCFPKISYKVEPPVTPIDTTTDNNFRIKETQDFLINTQGCYIPNYAKTFKYESSVKQYPNINDICGVRYIFIDTLGDDKIKFRMHKYTRGGVTCCYQFVSESTIPGHEHDQLLYTPCEVFTNNSIALLQQEVITVTCTNKTKPIYKDAYIILKKIKADNLQSDTNYQNTQWNVLMIGIDSMSRTRVFDTMPNTTKYLKKHKWLDFKAYHKVENNSLQNLMSVLTGKRMSTIYSNCTSDLYKCEDYFIWKKYKDAGYRTAHGESNILSETFCRDFKRSPTDHHMRPLFLIRTINSGDILCTEKKPSAKHLLEYAHKFIESYKTNNFFGIFWINTYTSYNNTPQLSDTDIVNLFGKLNKSGVFKNTFIVLFSDQVTSYGEMRLPMESYYENQLPMLFLWTPLEFRRYYTSKYYNLQVNQERLITPYDVYITLADILKLSIHSSEEKQWEACSQCTSLFEKISPSRTCADAGVDENWCSCHNMSKIGTDDERVETSLFYAVAHVQNKKNFIKTIPCTSCEQFRYPTIIRAHEYLQGGNTYHVIAFRMPPSELKFEALVVHYGYFGARSKFLSIRSMTRYNDRGNCALHSQDRPFCVCVFDNNCFHDNIVLDSIDPKKLKLADVIKFYKVENSSIT